jgi:hypothetical protein
LSTLIHTARNIFSQQNENKNETFKPSNKFRSFLMRINLSPEIAPSLQQVEAVTMVDSRNVRSFQSTNDITGRQTLQKPLHPCTKKN